MNKEIEQKKEDEILYIINKNNKRITEDKINKILEEFGIEYKINNIEYFQEALTHSSYCLNLEEDEYNKIINEIKYKKEFKNIILPLNKCYERLEFLGDSVIKPILTTYIYKRYPNSDEGFMSKLRANLERTNILSEFFDIINLKEYILISRENEIENVRELNNIKEDCFEAFIGALYYDYYNTFNSYGKIYDIITNIIIQLIEKYIDLSLILVNNINYKDKINIFCNKYKFPPAEYGEVKQFTDFIIKNNQKIKVLKFEMFIKLNNQIISTGLGLSKKEGEQNAAKNALTILNKQFNEFNVDTIINDEYIIDDNFDDNKINIDDNNNNDDDSNDDNDDNDDNDEYIITE